MTFHYTDCDGDALHIEPVSRHGRPAISLRNIPSTQTAAAAVHIPVNHVEELIAGLRDTARQAATQEQP